MARRDATSKKRQQQRTNNKKPKERKATTQTTATSSDTTLSDKTKAPPSCENLEDGPDCQCFLRRGLFLPPGMDDEEIFDDHDAAARR